MRNKKSQPKRSEVGLILAMLRLARGWTQGELAASAGVRRSSVSDHEQGKVVPEFETFERLIVAMGYSLRTVEEARAFIRATEAQHFCTEAPALASAAGSSPANRDALALEVGRVITSLIQRAVLDVQADRTLACPEAEPVSARELFERLSGAAPQERSRLVKTAEFRNWKLVPLLCDESLKAASGTPRLAREYAELALMVAEGLGRGEALRAKARGYALCHVGNVRRIVGTLSSADKAFAAALPHLALGASIVNTLFEEGRPASLLASLRLVEGRLKECLSLLDEAFRKGGSARLKATVLINKAGVLEEQGDLAASIHILEEAATIVPQEEPRLVLCIRQNLADALSKSGQYEAAAALFPEVVRLARRHASSLDHCRLKWIEGRVAGGLGRTEEAIGLLNQVRGELASEKIFYDTALVSLELAKLFASENRPSEVKALARHMVPIFKSEQLHREALAALALFRQAAEREAVTIELADEVRAYLVKARRNPGLRFEM